jgi:hypothetical protein
VASVCASAAPNRFCVCKAGKLHDHQSHPQQNSTQHRGHSTKSGLVVIATPLLPSNTPSSLHNKRQQRAFAGSGHPYKEIPNVFNATEKIAQMNCFVDTDRASFPVNDGRRSLPLWRVVFPFIAVPGAREKLGLKLAPIARPHAAGSQADAKPAGRSVHSLSLYFNVPAPDAAFQLYCEDRSVDWLNYLYRGAS